MVACNGAKGKFNRGLRARWARELGVALACGDVLGFEDSDSRNSWKDRVTDGGIVHGFSP